MDAQLDVLPEEVWDRIKVFARKGNYTRVFRTYEYHSKVGRRRAALHIASELLKDMNPDFANELPEPGRADMLCSILFGMRMGAQITYRKYRKVGLEESATRVKELIPEVAKVYPVPEPWIKPSQAFTVPAFIIGLPLLIFFAGYCQWLD